MTKQKLIKEYKDRIVLCDVELDMLATQIVEARIVEMDYDHLLDERRNWNAKRQIYVQVISDIEDLNVLQPATGS